MDSHSVGSSEIWYKELISWQISGQLNTHEELVKFFKIRWGRVINVTVETRKMQTLETNFDTYENSGNQQENIDNWVLGKYHKGLVRNKSSCVLLQKEVRLSD